MDSDQSQKKHLKKTIFFLEDLYGPVEWWPGNADQVMIGAILTQQTRWGNVEMALARLDAAGIKTLEDIEYADEAIIKDAIRCTGYFRLKTERLKELSSFVVEKGGVESLGIMPKDELRECLLGVRGVGAETADSILCYGLDMASFVIDSYTVRITGCAGISYKNGRLKALFESVLPESAEIYRTCHGWFVEYAKEYCVKKRCDECKIRSLN
ncbi:MAG: Fe-S cluster assembly protein HesB [Methanomicrobiaceae archaeon]|nr:Fe-S cluster assembly protein HesB [Methanomicrobiaceae archaeon]